MPPNQSPLTEQEAHERAVSARAEELRAGMYDAMQLWAATVEIMLMPWLQSPADLLSFMVYRLRLGLPERWWPPSLEEIRRVADEQRCRVCATL